MTRTLSVAAYVGTCLAVCVLLAMCGACAAFARPTPEEQPRGLNLAEQHRAAMYIYVACLDGNEYVGSGVLISSNRVLTAAHVVSCDAALIAAGPSLDDMRIAHVDRWSLDNDLARLKLDTPLSDIKPARTWGTPRAGDVICGSTAFPEPSWSCGEVVDLEGSERNNVDHKAPTEHGNSGSGMYDSQGRLVAIMTQCYTVADGVCGNQGGRATSLSGKGWLRP
jgi:S1-C subfamily serine protease